MGTRLVDKRMASRTEWNGIIGRITQSTNDVMITTSVINKASITKLLLITQIPSILCVMI